MRFAAFMGGLVALLGLSIILEAVFQIRLPLFRIGLGLFLLYLGVRVLLGGHARDVGLGGHSTVMAEQHFAPGALGTERARYDVLFGRAVVDLRGLPDPESDVTVEVNAIFASAVVLVDPRQPVQIDASAVFGAAKLPDGQSVSFGALRYVPSAVARPGARIRVKLNAVFGGAEMDELDRGAPMPSALPGSARPRPT